MKILQIVSCYQCCRRGRNDSLLNPPLLRIILHILSKRAEACSHLLQLHEVAILLKMHVDLGVSSSSTADNVYPEAEPHASPKHWLTIQLALILTTVHALGQTGESFNVP